MKAQAVGNEFIFQQDSAPAHTAKKTWNVLKEHGVIFWDSNSWPSNSPGIQCAEGNRENICNINNFSQIYKKGEE